MKRFIPSLAVLSLVACGAAPEAPFVPTITLAPGASNLAVRVERVKAGMGPVLCDLFNAAEGFPGPSPIIGGSQEHEAKESTVCVYERLPAGTFAMSVIQDENANGTLDSNVFGVPTEGYGVSNNIIPATEAPRWSDSVITLDGTNPLEITVTLSNSN
jgi:uncharacterized protein (DUF2141 family)